MKKLLQILSLAALLCVPWATGAQNTLTVANGTATSEFVPTYGYFVDNNVRCQIIYPASMLANMTGGYITSITFYSESSDFGWGNPSFNVLLGSANATSFESAAYFSTAQATSVYSGALAVTGDNNEVVVTFSTPYLYQGGNLLVEVNNPVVGEFSTQAFYGQTSTGASVYGYSDEGVASAVVEAVVNFMPKTTFAYTDPPANQGVAIPYVEGFENMTSADDLTDAGWSLLYKSDNSSFLAIETSASNVSSGSKALNIDSYSASSSSAYVVVGLPIVSQPINGLQITFSYKVSYGTVDIGYLTDADDATTFVSLQSFNSSSSYSTGNTVELNGAPANAARIAIKYTNYYRCYIDDIEVTSLPTCFKPTLTANDVSAITTTGATIGWTVDNRTTNPTNGWEIRYRVSGSNDNYTTVTAAGNVTSKALTGLTANTHYEVSVRANCGGDDYSDWTEAVTFTTPCETFVVDDQTNFNETFDGLTVANSIPNCWNNDEGTTTTASSRWCYNTSTSGNGAASGTGHSGNCVRFDSYNNYADNTNFLATQPIELSVASRLKFWYKNPAAGDLSVYISTDGGTTKTELATGLTGQSSWTEQVINLTNYTNTTVTIYFKGTSNYGYGDAYIYLDDVTVEPMPSCVEVDNIAVSAIGTTGATISWTTTNAESATYTISDGANLNVTTAAGATSYTFTTLAPATTYNLTITTNCGAQEQSDPATVPTFSTKCNAISDFPVVYGFETSEGFTGSSSSQTTNTLGACWRNENTYGSPSTNYLWSVNNSASYVKNGSQSLKLPDKSSGTKTMLVFPAMNFTNANGYVVSFWIYRNGSSSNAEGFKVYASNEDTISANAVDLGTYSRNYNQAYPNVESASGWYQYETAPITLTGTVYLIFEGNSYYGSATYVDDVVIEAAPSCRPVQNITFTNVERTSFTVNWENHPSATNVSSYEVVIDVDNLDAQSLESANSVTCTTTNYTFTGLNRETDYYVYVRANCGNDGYGEWVEGEVTTHGLTVCEDVAVASGSTTNGNVPFEGYYIDEYTQHSQSIYPASMLTELVGKSISSMTFRSNVASMNYGTTSTFKIGVTEASDVSSDFASTSGLTTVYTGSLSMSNNRLTITFNEPFIYNGGNLLVDFQSTSTGTYENTSFYGVTSTGASRYEGDGSATAYNFLPELTFHYCETNDACPAVTNITVSDITETTATVSWTPSTGDYIQGYWIDTTDWWYPENEYRTWPSQEAEYVQGGNSSEYTLENLRAYTPYYVVITPDCNESLDGNGTPEATYFRTASACRVPANITATQTGKNTVTVSWEAGSTEQTQNYQYFVEYGQTNGVDFYNNGGEPDVINNLGNVTSVELTNVPNNTWVNFYLRNNCGNTGYSPWVLYGDLRTYPEMPAVVNLQATQVTHSAIAVTWERNTAQFADEEKWMVECSGVPCCSTSYSFISHMDTMFLGLTPSTEYHIKVKPWKEVSYGDITGDEVEIVVNTEAMPTSCDIVVADGTVTNSNLPIYGTWTDADQVNQMIYPADLMAELNGKSLSSMKFFSNSDLTSWGTRNVTLKLAEVDAETLTTFVTPDSWTTVYSGDITKLADGFIMNFTTPYTYQGGNLLVEIDYETGTYVSKTFYGITRNNAGIYSYGNNAGTSGTVQNFLPKVQFCYQLDPNACLDVTNVSITNVTANSVDISWLPGNMETGWRYMLSGTEYNPTAQGTGAGNPIYVTHLSLSQLTVDFDYLFWIRPVDAQGNECGNWVSFPFSTLPTCGLPTLQPATNVTATTATISATPHATIGTASTYTFRYWIKGEENYKTTVAASANSSANLTNLTPNTTYYYEAMVSCTGNDGDSRWTEPMSFTTEYQNTTLPYSTSFSTSYIDDQHWRLVNGTMTNAWAIGSAADAADDGRALYVSNDGGVTNAYTISGANSVTYAYAGFSNFEADKQYTVIFDWKNRGENDSYDYLRAWLVPDNEEFDAYNPGYSMPYATTNPTNWIAVDGGSYLNNVTEWQHQTTYTFVPADGAYKLVFMWANDGSMGTNPPAAIDNVSIQESQQYTATAQVRPEGVGIGAVTGGGTFYEGTDILFELAAETPHGYGFLEWRDVYGNRITGESVLAHRVVADTMFLAIYDSNTYTITAVTANQAQGTAAVNGESTVKFNKPVTIVATPAPCYQFLNWTNEQGQVVSTDAEYTVNAYDSYTFTANFELSTFTGDTNASECDEFTWHGETYYDTPAQAPTFVYTTNDGCDSTVTLHLTINHSTDSTLVVVACDSYVMNLDTHEETYTETPAQMPMFIFQNAAGCDSTLTLNLTINHSTTGDTTAVACDEFTWYGDKYTMTPVTALPNHTFQNAAGCDSTVTLHLTIRRSNTGDTTAVACDEFTWYEHTNLTMSSDDLTHTFTNMYDCDSVVTLHLTVNNSNLGDTSVVACDRYTWINQVTYTSTPNVPPTFTLPSANVWGCDSTVTLYLTINTSTTGDTTVVACDEFEWYDNRYTMTPVTDLPTHTFVNGNAVGCDSTVTLDLTIRRSNTGDTTAVACDRFSWYEHTNLTVSSDDLTHTFVNEDGCDSVVTLNLTINTSSTGDTAAVACNTFSWYEHTNLTMSSDDMTHTFENVNGCDSLVTLHLTINNSNASDTTVVACDEFQWINQVTYEATPDVAPTVTLQNAAGCDSVVTLNLTIKYSSTGVDKREACDSYQWINGRTYTTSNDTAVYTLTNVAGCDSVVTLNLVINNSTTGDTTVVACDEFQWINQVTYDATPAEAPTFTLENEAGCDSTVTLHLTINNSSTGDTAAVACNTFSWYEHTNLTMSSDDMTHTFENVNGCDSVVTLHLTINNSNAGDTTVVACDEFTWINQVTYEATPDVAPTVTLQNAAGCDSVVTLNLTVNHSTQLTSTEMACDEYLWHGVTYEQSGNYTFDTVNAEGCPQHESLTLTINNSVVDSIEAVACGSYQWEYAIEPYTESGRYVIASETDFGCDEMHILNLTINNVVNTSLTEEACDSYTWNNEPYDQSGTYYFSHEDNNGCTQVDTLFLTVNYSTDTAIAVDVLENQLPYTFNGETFQGAVTNRDITIENAAGCDSVIHFTLNVEWNSTNTVDSSICASQLPFTWNDIVFTEAGTQSAVLTAVNGTDSTVVMTLNVYPQTGSDTAATACDNFTWYGEVYAMSNDSLTHVLTDVNGCDSIITLNLTINNSTESTETLTICNGYLWHDSVYTESGVHTYVTENQFGCMHTETLVLTVNVPVNELITVAACDSYTWNDSVYVQSGEYTYTHVDDNNCNQVDTLHLTINSSVVDSIEAVACDSYQWTYAIEPYMESGRYVVASETEFGCSETHILNLTINNSTESTETLTICNGYLWHDSVYTESGMHTFVTENQFGCTHTETLVLTVNMSVVDSVDTTVCNWYVWNDTMLGESGRYVATSVSDQGCTDTHILNLTVNYNSSYAFSQEAVGSFEWYDSVYTESGTYTHVLTNAAGCDSIINMTLTIVPGCVAVTIPFAEGFEGGVMPDCWNVDGPGNWTVATGDYSAATGAHSGTYNAKIVHSVTGNITKLITPVINFTGVAEAELRFWHIERSWSGDQDTLKVYYRTAATEAWQLLNSYYGDATYSEAIIALPNLSSTYQLAFEMVDHYGYGVAIDDISIDLPPACAAVATVNATADGTTANVVWANTGADNYQVQLSLNGDTLNTVTTTDTTAAFSGLIPDNDYQVAVRAVCGNNYSAWSYPVSVHIGYCSPNPTSRDGQGITAVSFGGMTNTTTHPTAAPFYGNYTNMSGTLPAGTDASVDITYATGFTYGTIIWVDWNKNMVFEGNEVIFSGESSGDNPTTLSVNFLIPATQDTGSYRMRIIGADMALDSYTASIEAAVSANPCLTAAYAVAEDYTLIVTEVPSCLPVVDLNATNVVANGATLTWSGDADSYTVYNMADTNNSLFVTDTTVVLTGLEGNTQYTFGVVGHCDSVNTTVVTVSFKTPCADMSIPYTENFDSYTTSTTAATGVYVPCWNYTMTGTSTYQGSNYQPKVYYSATYANSGSYSLRLYGVSYTMLPQMAEPLSGLQLTFNAYTTTSSYKLAVGVMEGETFVPVDTVALTTSTHNDITVYFGSYTGNSRTIAFRNYNTSATSYLSSIYIDDVTVDYIPSCFPVTDLTATATAHTATLTWADNMNSSATYTVSDTTGVIATGITGTTYTVTGLAANSDNTFYVAANCSATDMATAVSVNVHTDCDAEALPFTEDFSATLANSNCWRGNSSLTAADVFSGTPLVLGANTAWTYSSSTSNGLEAGHYRVNIYSNSCKKWMVTPAIALTGVTTAQLTFDVAFTAYSGTAAAAGYDTNSSQAFMVVVSTDGGQTWLESNATKWQNQGGNYTLASIAGTDYANQIINLNQYIGDTIKIAFYAQSLWSGGDNNLHLDNIVVSEVPTCQAVTALTATAAANEVVLNWTENNTGATHTIYNMGDTSVIASGITGNTYTVSGLTANTAYVFGVQATCSADDASAIVSVSTRTLCGTINELPYTCSFEVEEIAGTSSQDAMPWCWTRTTSAFTGTTYYPYSTSGTANTGSRSLYFYGTTSTATTYPDTMGAALPQVNTALFPLNGLQLSLYAKMGTATASKAIYVGTMTDPTNEGTFTLLNTVEVTGNVYNRYDIDLTGAPATDSYVAFYVVKGTGTMYIDDVILHEIPTCLYVTDLAASDITPSSVTLTWNDSLNNGATYTVYNGDSVVATGLTATTYTVSGLDANTAYNFSVAANCSATETSEAISISARTACAVEQLPFTEDFSVTLANDPCWRGASILYADGVTPTLGNITGWAYQNSVNNGLAAGHYRVNIFGTTCKYWLVTPTIDLSDATNPALTFDAAFTVYTNTSTDPANVSNIADDKFMVLVSTNEGESWSVANNFDLTALASSTYLPQTVSLSQYVGHNVKIAFYTESTVSGGDNNLHIDNIAVAEAIDTTPVLPDSLTVFVNTADASMGTTNPQPGTYRVAENDTLWLNPVAFEGYHFTHWTEEVASLANTPNIITYDTIGKFGEQWLLGDTINLIAYFEADSTPIDDDIATVPYTCDFEQEGDNGWVFVDSVQVNYWMIGSGATANSGNAMFITNDGINNAYTVNTPAYSFATRKVRISEAGSYTYSFDWIANGESSYDFLRTALVPASVEFIPGEYNGFNNTTAVPTGAIALDGGRLNQVSTWQTRSGEIVVTDTGLYNIVFMWRNDNSTGTQPPAAIDNVSFTMTACPMVQNVVVDPTANSIALSWTAGGSETSWEVTCGGVSHVVNTNAYTFNGLVADTDYVVSVRAICGADDSSLIHTETVHTPCAAVSIPYSENFDELTTSTTAATGVYVPCWNYIMTGTSTYQGSSYQPKVYYSATYANSGSYSLRLYGVSYTMLPPMAESLSDLQLSFNVYNNSTSYKLAVGVMEGNTFVPIDTLTTPSSQHTPCTVYFGGYTGNSRIIAFRNFGTSSTSNYTYMYIDDVTVDYLPSCVSVTNLTATATAHSVELTWADYLNSSATYTVSDATGVLATGQTATTYTVTGLNANTDYTFSVTANCSADASGDAVSVTVHTDCDVEALPFMEDFSASLLNDACWRGNSSLTAADVFSGTPLVLGANTAWTYTSSTSNGLEAGHYRVNIFGNSCKKWMVTPAIALTGVTTAQLTFDVAFTAYTSTSNAPASNFDTNSSQAFMVVVSTDGGQTWPEANAIKWQNEGGNYTLASIASSNYVNQIINLNQYIGDTVKIAFYAQSLWSGGDNNLHIDNIIVSEVPSCPNVMGLTLDSQDSASANISWNANGANSYEVQVVRNNSVDTTVNVVVIDTTAHISGLMVDNDYQVSVRAICGANAGLWSNPLNIHIGYCMPNPTSIDNQGITSVTFGGMTNSTTHPTSAPYYGNYANMSGSVAAGTEATVEITYATGYTYGTVIWVDWDHSMSFDTDEQVYIGQSTSTNPTTLIATFNIPATTATGSYRMRIAGADSHFDSGTPDPCFTSSYAVAEDYTLIVTEAPACLPVSNLTASNVTANGATLTWSGNADSYYVYNVADATAGQTVTDTTVVLTGLNANTEYTYAVVSGCDTSNVATVTFATLCNAVAIPFTETFEENSATIACWSNEGSSSWTYGVGDNSSATGAYEGARNARVTHTTNGAVTRLVSPVLDFGQAEGAKMTYAHIQRSWTGDQDQLAVLYRTSSNGEWIELANYTSEIATWTVDSVMLPATAFQVAFQMTDGYGYGVAIDSIVFSMPDTTPVVLPDSVLVVVSPAMPAHGTTSMNGTPGMASGIFHEGDIVVATATPDSGYLFDYWSIAYLTSGTELTTVYDTVYTNPFVLNIDSNNVTNTMITLLANFQAENGTLDSLTIVLSTADATMGTTNPAPGTYRLGEGDSLMFVPVAYDGYHFTHWSYEIVGITQTPYISTDDTVLRVAQTWLLDNTINYVAYFAPDSVGPDTTWYTVNVVYDTLMGTVTGAGQYADSTVASLMAVPAQCHHFVAWTNLAGDTLATEPVYSFTVVDNANIIATFAPNAITGLGETLVACDSLLWHDSVYTMSGTYLYEYLNDNQCASVDTLYLTVNYSNTGVETVTACNSYIWHGTEYFASTNEPTYTETNAAECDSVVTLNLTINECSTTTINTCDSYTWSVNNVTYTQSGIYVDGNDTLDLTLRYSNAATDVQEACDSYAWIDDSVYTASTSTATYTLTNAAGCDSVVTLNLTIHNSDATVETLTACDSYQWNGALYTESNSTDTMMLTNQYGCDSIVTLNLTVNYSTSSVDTVEACNSYVWHGTEYFASTNQPTYTLTNAAGCDSVVTLNLTINQCATTVINTCDSYTWSVNNVTYTQGGIYVDGTDTLDLTLGYSSAATDVQQACDSYTWIDGLVYTASSSNATYTLTNAAGCDSVVTLNLTVNYTVFSTEDVVATPGYTIGNNVFNESTVFVDTLTAATGCDSVVTYNITIVDTIWYNVNVNYDQTRGVVYGAGQYAEGSEATLTAVANSGYVFMGFLVGNETVVTDSSYTFTVTSDVDVMAVFAVDFVPILADSVTFYVAVNNAQMGTTTPAPGAYRFAVGDTASVEAVANEGYHFEYWVVNALGMTDTLYDAHYSGVLPMQLSGLSIGVTAVFAEDTAVVVTYHVTGLSNDTTMGRVIGSGPYVEGSVATLTAMANSGFRFDHWSNGETTSTIQFIVTGDTTFTAYFVPIDGIEDADEAEVTVYSSGLRIIVNGATGSDVRLFDVNGRLISTAVDAAETVEFRVVATGVYLIKVGNAPAKRVLVVR